MDKAELLEALEDGHNEWIEMLESLPDELMVKPGVIGNWSIKDTLAHLSMWEAQLVTMLYQASRGIETPTTAHFGKETVDEVNQRWLAASQERPLNLIWADWVGVRNQTIRRVAEFSEKDLNDEKKFAWLKGVPLWQWIANDSFDHADEHGSDIREWLDRIDTSASNGHNLST